MFQFNISIFFLDPSRFLLFQFLSHMPRYLYHSPPSPTKFPHITDISAFSFSETNLASSWSIALQSMDRRISKANTNYIVQRHCPDGYLKKHSCNEEDWRLAASSATPSLSHSLALFFDAPQALLNHRRLEHYATTQRLRQGVYILKLGRIRVLLGNPSKNTSKVDIQHAISKMENSSKFKYASSKLNILELTQPYQVVICAGNCLALPNTECWFVSPEELVHQRYFQNRAKLSEFLSANARVFTVNSQLPFIFKLISLSFRNKVELSDSIQLAIIKKGSIRVQWRNNACQQLIISEGSVIVKKEQYLYSCQSADAQLIGIEGNKTFKFLQDPLWTKSPEAAPPNLPKERNPNELLLFRSRSINLQRLTASGSRDKYKKSMSVQKDHKGSRLLTMQTAVSTPNYREAIKQNWLFMRKIQNYQVASNTRSEIEYQRIEAIRQRFKKEKEQASEMPLQNECLKKKPRAKIKFVKFTPKQSLPNKTQHLFHSVNSFFHKHLTHNSQ